MIEKKKPLSYFLDFFEAFQKCKHYFNEKKIVYLNQLITKYIKIFEKLSDNFFFIASLIEIRGYK